MHKERTSIRIAYFTGNAAPAIGGMEIHEAYFRRYFTVAGSLQYTVYRSEHICVCDQNGTSLSFDGTGELVRILKEAHINVLFFNAGYWIEELLELRMAFPTARFLMRSGGNDFVKAPMLNMALPIERRQAMWAEIINECVDYFIVNSFFTRKRAALIGISSAKIFVVRGGVDLPVCRANDDSRKQLRNVFDSRYGTQGKTLLAIVSRMEDFKGVLEVLDVLEKHQTENWHLVLAGDGRVGKDVVARLKKKFSAQKYTYLGSVSHSQALEIIALSDWIINCSLTSVRKSGADEYVHTETMGRTMMESITSRTPIVATDVGGIRELFLECDYPGVLLNTVNGLDGVIKRLVDEPYRLEYSVVRNNFDWQQIFSRLYIPLMGLGRLEYRRNVLVCDVDGTVVHDFFSAEENEKNMESLLSLSAKCILVLNTARDYDELLKAYSVVRDFKDRICIIANCGMRASVYGEHIEFIGNYGNHLMRPEDEFLQSLEDFVARQGGRLWGRKFIDKFYVNYKYEKVSDMALKEISLRLENVGFEVCLNESNIKFVSQEINKGKTLMFLLAHCLSPNRVIGVGNGVLDIYFLDLCDRRYLVNPVNATSSRGEYVPVMINSCDDFKKLIGGLDDELAAR